MNAKALIIWLIVGAVAGWLAGMVVKGGGYGQANPMCRGQWTRWGRGMCEGWSLEIGAFRASVVRRETDGESPIWIASVNSTGLGEFLEREIAMRRVEEQVESSMVLVLHDWERYRTAKAKR